MIKKAWKGGKSSGAKLDSLAEDLEYFDSMLSDEKNLLIEKINQELEKEKNPYNHLKVVSDVLVANQAQLAARVKVLEQVLLGRVNPLTLGGDPMGGAAPENVYALMDDFEVPVSAFAHKPNLYGLEQADNNLSYAWVGPSPEMEFDVPVKRDSNKMFRLGFVAVADDALLKNVQLIVDGHPQTAREDFDGATRGLICMIPARAGGGVTRVTLKLERTISPSESGNSADKRELGLAITGYKVTNA